MDLDNTIHSAPPSWAKPGWLDQVSRWIQAAIEQEDMTITWPIEQAHQRPWSTVLRVPTNGGDFYFKACAPVLGYEAAVTEALYRWQPNYIPPVLQFDAGQGWLLMADGGPTLRNAFNRKGASRSAPTSQNAPTIDSWREVLALYAGLQIDLVIHVDELLLLGSPDRRLALLPDLYRDLLEEPEWLLIDQPDGLTTAEYQRLLEATPQVTALCRQLAGCDIPMSLHHNDLHDANIFFNESRTLFFDWGDSSIAHPFFSLRTAFISIEYTFGLDEQDPIFDQLAQDYLQPWTALETVDNVTAAFKLAQRLWALSTAVKYKTLLRHQEALRDEYASAVPGLLQEFLEANPEF